MLLDDGVDLLDEIGGRLLRDHPVVTLDGGLREVIVVELYQPTSTTKPMPSAGASTSLDPIGREPGTQTLQPRRRGMHIGQRGEIATADPLARRSIQLAHRQASVMQCKCCGQQRQYTDLYSWIVQDGHLGAGVAVDVAISELASDREISHCDGDGTSEDEAGVHDYVDANGCQASVHDGGIDAFRPRVRAGVDVDLGVAAEEGGVWDPEMVEETICVVHGSVSVFRSDVADNDAG